MSTSLDTSKPEKRKLLLRCLGDCDSRLTDQLNKKLLITDYFAHQIQLTDKATGEIKDAVRMVLIDTEGKTYECVAAVLIKSFQGVMFAYGKPPWPKGVTLEVLKKTSGLNNIFTFKAI